MSVYDVKNPIATTTGQTTTTLFNPFTTIPYTIPITTNYSIPTTTQYTISTSPSTTLYNQNIPTVYNTNNMPHENNEYDINNNVDNLNDFMAKNTLIGSNLYISPMNSTGIDDINRKKQYSSNKIASSFFPIVKLA